MKGLRRHCLTCGRLVRGQSRCGACSVPKSVAYGPEHQRARASALRALQGAQGAICAYCLKPLGSDGRFLELDHAQPVVDGGLYGPKRLVHAKCNSRAGGIRGTTYRRRASDH